MANKISRIKIRLLGEIIKVADGLCSDYDIDCDVGCSNDDEPTFDKQYQGFFSSIIIDRADEEIKFLHFPASLAYQFRQWNLNYGENAGGVNGPDWIVDTIDHCRSCNGYQWITSVATPLFRTPITNEMIAVAESLKDALGKFNKTFSPTTVPLSVCSNYATGIPCFDARIITMTSARCNHKWIDVGFFSGKQACKHCNMDKMPDSCS